MESGPPRRPDSVRVPTLRHYDALFCSKNPAFLTRSWRDATYSVGMKVAYQESRELSAIRRDGASPRVLTEVHNK
jgi:hypothetical protein